MNERVKRSADDFLFSAQQNNRKNGYNCFAAVTAWPEGTYGLPKAKYGCPVSLKTKWTTGWRFEDTENTNPNSYKSTSFHLDAVVEKSNVNRTFCMKDKDEEKTEWPKGKKQNKFSESAAIHPSIHPSIHTLLSPPRRGFSATINKIITTLKCKCRKASSLLALKKSPRRGNSFISCFQLCNHR